MLWCQDNPQYIQNVAECADVIGFCFVSVSVFVLLVVVVSWFCFFQDRPGVITFWVRFSFVSLFARFRQDARVFFCRGRGPRVRSESLGMGSLVPTG